MSRGLKVRVVALALAVFVMAASTEAAFSWVSVGERVSKSIVRLEIERGVNESGERMVGICTAFSINRSQRFYQTAAHCYGDQMHVGAHMARPVFYRPEKDLMILEIPGLAKPALRAARDTAPAGTPVAAVGFGQGLEQPSVRSGAVQIADILRILVIGDIFDFVTYEERFTQFDFTFEPGMSGGPVVDQDGRVVSVVQAGSTIVGYGRPLRVILDETASYWE